MKICLINNIFYPYSRGGADKVSKIIADNLIKEGDDVFVITTKTKRGKIDSGKYSAYYLYSNFQNLNQMPFGLRLFWHLFDNFNLVNYFKTRSILKKEKPDLVITNNLKGIGFLTPLCIKKQKIKHIHILHDIQLIHPSGLMHYGEEKKIETYFSKLYGKINSYLFSEVNAVVSPSQWLLAFHQKHNFFQKNKTLVLPNPIVIGNKEIKDKKIKKGTFVCVGEIEKHKGVLFLVDVFKKIQEINKNYSIIFIGEGKEKDIIKQEAKKNNFIKYLGKIDNKKVLEEISQAEALIMPSLCYENSPTVIYEAYSQKTPVIASRIGGITELVRTYGGILFKPNDKKDLIKKINYLIDKEENYPEIKIDLDTLSVTHYIKKLKSL